MATVEKKVTQESGTLTDEILPEGKRNPCPICHTDGQIPVSKGNEDTDYIPCYYCQGRGTVPA